MSAIRKLPIIQSVIPSIQVQQDLLTIPTNMMSDSARSIYQQVKQSLIIEQKELLLSTQNIRPTALKLQRQALDLCQKSNVPLTEAAQVAALLAADMYMSANSQTIQQNWTHLKSATSLESTKVALGNLIEQLELNHHQVVVDHLVLACQNAAYKVGFQPLESSATAVNGTVRLIASDDTGRSLVTEIATHPNHPVQMATEIIGSSDRTCEDILDKFETALQEEGVTYAPSQRKFTGGICELEAAKDFVRDRSHQKTQLQNQTPKPKKKVKKKVKNKANQRPLSPRKINKQGF